MSLLLPREDLEGFSGGFFNLLRKISAVGGASDGPGGNYSYRVDCMTLRLCEKLLDRFEAQFHAVLSQ